jgi:hypothetical protein
MNDDLAKIKKILEDLDPSISVVEFIPPPPPRLAADDEDLEQEPKSKD